MGLQQASHTTWRARADGASARAACSCACGQNDVVGVRNQGSFERLPRTGRLTRCPVSTGGADQAGTGRLLPMSCREAAQALPPSFPRLPSGLPQPLQQPAAAPPSLGAPSQRISRSAACLCCAVRQRPVPPAPAGDGGGLQARRLILQRPGSQQHPCRLAASSLCGGTSSTLQAPFLFLFQAFVAAFDRRAIRCAACSAIHLLRAGRRRRTADTGESAFSCTPVRGSPRTATLMLKVRRAQQAVPMRTGVCAPSQRRVRR